METRSDVGHLRPDKLLRSGQRAQLVGRPHRRHIEVHRQQTAIFVSDVSRALGSDLSSRQPIVEFDVLRPGWFERDIAQSGRQGLLFAEADFLRHPVFGKGEVFGS